MDPPSALGTAMSRPAIAGLALAASLLVQPSPALAADRYAVVITGASGGEAYAAKYDGWRSSLITTLRQRFKYPDDHLFVLAEREGQDVAKATRENVRRVLGGLRSR